MVFQVPEAAYAAYIVFLITREDVVATVLAGLVATAAATFAVALAIVLTAFDAGSAALRIPIMAVTTMAAMYASRALKLGPAAFLAGYILVLGQTLVDQFETPEAVVHALLWLWVLVAVPVGVLVLVGLVTGERPAARARRSALALLRALASSLRSPGAGGPKEDPLTEAVDLLASTRKNAMIDATAKGRLGSDLRLMETLETLLLMAVLLPVETPLAVRAALAGECDACAEAYERGEPPAPRRDPVLSDAMPAQAPAAAQPVVQAMAIAFERLREGLDRRARGLVEPMSPEDRPRVIDAAERRDNVLFGVKSSIAVMSAYLIYTGFGYFEISTAVTTCFFVSLGSLGESVQKLTLRIAGAVVGGFAAGLCIAFVRPSMTDIGQLSLLIGLAAGVCGWVAASSVRLSYMALQTAFAFFLGILQGYAPPGHFKPMWDRVIGILVGNVLVTVVFSTLWPTSAHARAQKSIAHALQQIAKCLEAGASRVGTRLALLESIDKARWLDEFAKFELGMIPTPSAESLQPVSVPELERAAGLAFVAAELPGSPVVAEARALLSSELERARAAAS
jgi:multidrug resistance protein MdtO